MSTENETTATGTQTTEAESVDLQRVGRRTGAALANAITQLEAAIIEGRPDWEEVWTCEIRLLREEIESERRNSPTSQALRGDEANPRTLAGEPRQHLAADMGRGAGNYSST